jgi:hypothetical protein
MSEEQISKVKNLKSKNTLKILSGVLVGCLIVLALCAGFLLGNYTGTWDMISTTEENLRNVYSNETQLQLKQWLTDEPLNFTEGLVWQSHLVKFEMNRPSYQNVAQVLKDGEGACGENVWVYSAFCVAKGIHFRIVTVGYFFPGVVDHAWIQVNPSGDGKTWIQIDVADTCAGLQDGKTIDQLWNNTLNNNSYYAGKHYKMVLAYELNSNNEITITDVTKTFS